jgi:hypothetical protein
VRETKGMEVLHTRTNAAHTSPNVERVRDILVLVLQDDVVYFKPNVGQSAAIAGATIKSDDVRMGIVFQEVDRNCKVFASSRSI